jgi:putative hydrolase
MTMTNLAIAELLARSVEEVEEVKRRSFRRASRGALAWPEEAASVLEQDRPLTELHAIGPRLALRIERWVENPPALGDAIPEARSGFSTLSVGRSIIDGNPSWRSELRADLQMHSTYSDGTVAIEEMALAARSLGHSYIAITDHSEGLRVAGGMTPEQLAEQKREIDELRERLSDAGIRLLHGIEMNLDEDGEGDTGPKTLAPLDLVLGSFHSKLRRTSDQTPRYLAAVNNPLIDILGHPRGRMYDRRAGLHADWGRVFDRAASTGVALEIDCNPNRQDLNAELAAKAAAAGCWVSIGTDAHSTYELTFIDLGVATVLAAGVPRERVLNYMDAEELLEWSAKRKMSALDKYGKGS